MYIWFRLKGSDPSIAYVEAYTVFSIVDTFQKITEHFVVELLSYNFIIHLRSECCINDFMSIGV